MIFSWTSILLPPAAAALLCLLARRFRRPELRRVVLAAVPAASFACAFVSLSGWPPLPFTGVTLTARAALFWLALAALPLYALRTPVPSIRTGLLACAVLVAVARAVLSHRFEGTEGALVCGAFFVGLVGQDASLRKLSERSRNVHGLLALSIGGLSAVAGFGRNALMSQLSGSLAVALLVLWLGGRAASDRQRAEVTHALVLQFGLAFALIFYGKLPLVDVALVTLAPTLGWLVSGPSSRRTELVRAAIVAAPIVSVVVRAAVRFAEDPYFG